MAAPELVNLDRRRRRRAAARRRPWTSAAEPCRWLAARGDWLRIACATLDLSGPYQAVFDTVLPDATQIADPFLAQRAPSMVPGVLRPGAMVVAAP